MSSVPWVFGSSLSGCIFTLVYFTMSRVNKTAWNSKNKGGRSVMMLGRNMTGARLAQLVELWSSVPMVVGSSPRSGACFPLIDFSSLLHTS